MADHATDGTSDGALATRLATARARGSSENPPANAADLNGKERRRRTLPDTASACTGMRTAAPQRRLPKLGLHRATGQARITLSGVTHYLGKAGSVEAHARYAELVNQWIANDRRPLRQTVTVVQATITIRSLFEQFLAHADASGRYWKQGEPTRHRSMFVWICDSFATALKNLPVARLSESSLVAWRDVLEQNRKRTRSGINRLVAGALQVLRWGRARGLVPKAVFADVAAIEPIKRGEAGGRPEHGRPRRAVSAEEAAKVAAKACRQVGAMIRLQALVGMRPGEICAIRWADIDKTPIPGDTTGSWLYVVAHGKTEHHGHVTRYVLPPSAQRILEQFPALPTAFIFSPTTAMAERRHRLRASRKTPPTKQTALRDAKAQRDYSPRWGINEYRHAVERACCAAGVQRFTPHELRHGFVTWAANALSLGAAAAAANHRNLTTTQRYVHIRHEDALAVAAAVERRVSG